MSAAIFQSRYKYINPAAFDVEQARSFVTHISPAAGFTYVKMCVFNLKQCTGIKNVTISQKGGFWVFFSFVVV